MLLPAAAHCQIGQQQMPENQMEIKGARAPDEEGQQHPQRLPGLFSAGDQTVDVEDV